MRLVFAFLTALSLTATVLMPTQVAAQDSALTIRNVGGLTCKKFSEVFSSANQPQNKQIFTNWVGGYMTGTARAKGIVDVFPIDDTFQFIQFVVLVCNENLELRVETAAAISLVRLERYQVKGDPSRLTLSWNGQKSSYARVAVKPLQEDLIKLGAQISADGAYGNKTGAAIQTVARSLNIGNAPFPTGTLLYVLTRP